MKTARQPIEIDKQLLKAVASSNQNLSQIAAGADVPRPMLHRFVNDGKDIYLKTAVKLAAYFGMELTDPKPPATIVASGEAVSQSRSQPVKAKKPAKKAHRKKPRT